MTRNLFLAALLALPVPAHAEGAVSAAIGFVVSAMQPTYSSPDNTSYGDDDDD